MKNLSAHDADMIVEHLITPYAMENNPSLMTLVDALEVSTLSQIVSRFRSKAGNRYRLTIILVEE